ncbi:hypothetical protein DXG03_006975 [Asterophora parasitica]|uniref:Uncharacterized protein n=1 Tax=Asterophora parasitica TaxID=117018 RepID=A0A9P7KHP2_9AGAR|nr:hypothetical protein DXG03_006975 [Asterophora parasitica]
MNSHIQGTTRNSFKVSSPHRKEAFVACEYILEAIKQKAQIWKREYYEGEREDEAEWKANE